MYDPHISVLFVDTQRSTLNQTRELLASKENLHVDAVYSLQDTRERLKQKTYDTVVFNCDLLQKNALGFLRTLREKGNRTPFIFIAEKKRSRKIEPEALNLEVYRYIKITGNAEAEAPVLLNAMLNAAKRKRITEELKASEEKFRAISETAKDGIILIDEQGRIIFWNDAAQKIFGYETEEVFGKPLDILMPVDRAHSFDEARGKMFVQLREKGAVAFPGKTVQMPGVRKDGVALPTEISLSAMKIGGKWQGLAIVRDITERQRAENEILLQKETLRATLASSPNAVIITDMDGQVIDCNEVTLELFRYSSKNDVVGKNSIELVVEAERKRISAELKKVTMGKGIIRTEEFVALKNNGEDFTAEVSSNIFKDHRGCPSGIVSIIRDITQQKKAEEHIRLLSSVAQQTVEGIAVTDLKGQILFVNSAWLKMHDFSENEAKELMGRWILQFYCMPQLDFIDNNFQPDGVFRGRITHVRKDGTTFTVLASLSPLKSEDGEIVGIIHMAKNLTDIVRDIRDVKFTSACILDAKETTVNQA